MGTPSQQLATTSGWTTLWGSLKNLAAGCIHGQVTCSRIEEAHSQVEGLRDLPQRAVVRREAGVLPSTSPLPPPVASESAHSLGDNSSESSVVLISPEDSLSEGE